MATRARSLLDREILWPAVWESFVKLDPRVQLRNPVMFIVEVGRLQGAVRQPAGRTRGQ